MVHVLGGVRGHEEGVVVDVGVAPVDVREDGNVFAGGGLGGGGGDVEEVGGREIEVRGVEAHLGGEVPHAEAVVSELYTPPKHEG